MASKYAELTWPHDQGVEVVDIIDKGGVRYLKRLMYSAQKMEVYLANGYTFTPLLPLTPERVEALRRAIVALNEEQSEYMTVQYPSARDLEIESAVDVLEKLLKEAEGATDE